MLKMRKTNLPHVMWVELNEDGIMHEVAVMKQDDVSGDLYFFHLNGLDDIDKRRLLEIEKQRHADTLELWDLMRTHTLRNGVNALEYFHQLVQVRTAGGKIITPQDNVRGAGAIVAPTTAGDETSATVVRRGKAAKAAE